MSLKVITVLASVVTYCALVNGHAISEQNVIKYYGELGHIGEKVPVHHEDYAPAYPAYEFSYRVEDPHTHDMKGQHESRHGDEVKGQYWLIQPDGLKRTVTYLADKHGGFKAHVVYSDPHLESHEKHIEHKHEEEHKSVIENKLHHETHHLPAAHHIEPKPHIEYNVHHIEQKPHIERPHFEHKAINHEPIFEQKEEYAPLPHLPIYTPKYYKHESERYYQPKDYRHYY